MQLHCGISIHELCATRACQPTFHGCESAPSFFRACWLSISWCIHPHHSLNLPLEREPARTCVRPRGGLGRAFTRYVVTVCPSLPVSGVQQHALLYVKLRQRDRTGGQAPLWSIQQVNVKGVPSVFGSARRPCARDRYHATAYHPRARAQYSRRNQNLHELLATLSHVTHFRSLTSGAALCLVLHKQAAGVFAWYVYTAKSLPASPTPLTLAARAINNQHL